MDRPILFSGPMVRALLAGTKTQTRRLPSLARYRGFTEFGPSDTKGYDWHLRDSGMRWHDLRHAELLNLLPHQVGDRLYVREAWRCEARYDDVAPRDIRSDIPIYYVADPDPRDCEPGCAGRFRQGMHMPRWASRLTLTVTYVRVQRLQEISEADAIAEGCCGCLGPNPDFPDEWDPSPAEEYRALWNRLNAARGFGWSTNPWVVALTFTIEHRNIDAEVRDA